MTKRVRDFSKEHARRQETRKRLLVDLDRVKCEAFISHLKSIDTTYAQWINRKIDEELK